MKRDILDRVIHEEKGLTLLELIISLVLISIIALAAFRGMQFAYNVTSSSKELILDSYTEQAIIETDVSMVWTDLSSSEVISGVPSTTEVDTDETEELYFRWIGAGTDPDQPSDFKATGVMVTRKAQGGSYMDLPIRVFIPVTVTETP